MLNREVIKEFLEEELEGIEIADFIPVQTTTLLRLTFFL